MGYRVKRLQDFTRGMRESRRLLERERWPRARIESFQRERLAELTRYAAERAPVWRERVAPGTTEPTDLPVLTKAQLMEDFDGLVTDPRLRLDALLEHLDRIDQDELYLDEYRAMTSSGSSGRKAVFSTTAPAGRAWPRCSSAAPSGPALVRRCRACGSP